MRSPHRIPPFLRAFQDLWEENPDQRFGQLVMNLCRRERADDGFWGGFDDPWNWEDSEWYRRMEAYLAKYPASEGFQDAFKDNPHE